MERLENRWETGRSRSLRAVAVAGVLIFGVILIEVRRLLDASAAALPEWFAAWPTNHLVAIGWAMTILLVFEVVSVVLSLSRSVANTLGRQLEVYALILIRDAFVGLTELPEPIGITGHYDTVMTMSADAGGAIALFGVAALYRRLQRHVPIAEDEASQRVFVRIKRVLATGMLALLVGLIVSDVYSWLWGEGAHEIFDVFFTALVFVDVLLALVSIGFTDREAVVFRNFGFAFAAVLLRLALAAPDLVRPALGIAGGFVAVIVTLAYNFDMDVGDRQAARRRTPVRDRRDSIDAGSEEVNDEAEEAAPAASRG